MEFSKWIVVETDDIDRTIELIKQMPDKIKIKKVNESTANLYNFSNSIEVTKYLVNNGIGVKQIHFMTDGLENYYTRIINQNLDSVGGKENE